MALGLRDVVQRHGPAYLARFGDSMLSSHRAALHAIRDCRTPALGGHIAVCTSCGVEHDFYHSCRNRACPRCGADAAERWLDKQRAVLLPVPYFHLVFTVPDSLRRLIRAHQKPLLGALFGASFESLAVLVKDPQFLGASQIGALSVLHTWTRTLEWHPHIHMLVPGCGLTATGAVAFPPARDKPFLVPVHALSDIFRAIFMRRARAALPELTFPKDLFDQRWVTFVKPAVQGADKVLEYLGRYIQRTALSDKAILGVGPEHVTFGYRRTDETKRRLMRLQPDEFLRRFLQHVLPKGFHRVRAFGLLHPAHRTSRERLCRLLSPPSPSSELPLSVTSVTRSLSAATITKALAQNAPSPDSQRRCKHCKGLLVLVRFLTREECLARAAPPPQLSLRPITPLGSSP